MLAGRRVAAYAFCTASFARPLVAICVFSYMSPDALQTHATQTIRDHEALLAFMWGLLGAMLSAQDIPRPLQHLVMLALLALHSIASTVVYVRTNQADVLSRFCPATSIAFVGGALFCGPLTEWAASVLPCLPLAERWEKMAHTLECAEEGARLASVEVAQAVDPSTLSSLAGLGACPAAKPTTTQEQPGNPSASRRTSRPATGPSL